jgi:mRNA interferase RelE/StbE
VDAKITQLQENPCPRGAKKLFDDIYRIRVGDYRVIYRVDDTKRLVDIGKVERRRERTYQDIGKLFD